MQIKVVNRIKITVDNNNLGEMYTMVGNHPIINNHLTINSIISGAKSDYYHIKYYISIFHILGLN